MGKLLRMSNALTTHSEAWRSFGVKAVAGDHDAIGNLLELYRPLLMAISIRDLTPDLKAKSGASDLVQQTCKDAIIGITNVRAKDGHQFWGWLSSLHSKKVYDLRRRCIDSRKRSVRREEMLTEGAEGVTTGERSVFHQICSKETAQQLHVALSRIPLAHREVLRWRFLEEKSCEEIAQTVSRSPDAVRMMVSRALKKLEQVLPRNNSSVC